MPQPIHSNPGGAINAKFTVLKNTAIWRGLRDRINRAEIGPHVGFAMVTVLRTPARPELVRSATCHMEPPMKNLIARFVKDQSGATAIEYGLIAAGISLAIIAVVNGLGSNLNGKFSTINSSLK
jgi:pilus assembly protein Flp/PilA